MKILLVLAHPRRQSLSGQVADVFAAAAIAKGHAIEFADLQEEGFDPVLAEADEPDWDNPAKVYSPAVLREMARIERNDATVMVFPIWWWSMPALLKGWIDRVWNHGWAYGGGKSFPQQRVWMLAIAGADTAPYVKRGYDQAMQVGLDIGILDYCDIKEHRLEMLYGAMEGDEHVARILARARELGEGF